MPETNLPQEDNWASDIIGVANYGPEKRPEKKFLPWHKPRKQFVRHFQWCEQIIKMVDEVMPENKILKYLGLPGDDLLDLRYFHDTVCVPKELRLKFLGFNHGASAGATAKAELNISLDEVNKLQFVDPTSDVIGDDFCQIAKTNSIAWQRSQSMGPFDVINIDLCDGFGSQPTDEFQETHYNTMARLMALQSRRPNPWLLLITTRTGLEYIDATVLERLRTVYNENLTSCPPFNTASTEKFAISNEHTLNESITSNKGASDMFLISLCKWIANIAGAQVPPVKIELKSVLGYKVKEDSEHQDLVSIAIKIDPTVIATPDIFGLANQPAISSNECTTAVKILNRVANLVDVDSILEKDADLMNQMIGMSSILLDDARYNISSYEAWARIV